MIKKILLVGAIMTTLSCAKESPKLEYKVFNEKVASADSLEFNTKVDILFVVDDSGSMAGHQANLVGNASVFLDAIGRNRVVDYHIGVLSSSMDSFSGDVAGKNGRLVKKDGAPTFIDNNTKNGLFILKNYLRVGTDGSATECFFSPVQAALTAPIVTKENKGFLRDDATLAVIFITDAEDQSKLPKTYTDYPASDFYKFMVDLKKGNPKKAVLYSLIIPSAQTNTSDCARDEYNAPPLKIEDAIQLLKGHEYNLCDANYNSNLGALGRDIVSRVAVVHLTRTPDPTTIVIKYGTKILPNDVNAGWTYNPMDNTIVFGEDLMKALNGTADNLSITFTAVPESI